MQDRQFQLEHIDKIMHEVYINRVVLGQQPTGGGKTVEFSLITQRYYRKENRHVLILVHREELMYQTAEKIREICGLEPFLITSKTKTLGFNRVYIGMVESTMSRLHLMMNVGLVIIDECHRGNFTKVHETFRDDTLIIGFTATPISASKYEPLNKYYKEIIPGAQISELISMGFLSQNITRCPEKVIDSTKLEINKMSGDFDEKAMSAEYSKPRHITNVIEAYFRHCNNQKTIIFNVTIEHSKEVAKCFRACGYDCKHVDGATKERKEIFKWFKETENAILCNVMVANEGFDEPTILNVIQNFSTLALPKFIQTSGRGSRVINDYFIEKYQHEYPYQLEYKDTFQIIDMGGNYLRHGDWNNDRDWRYIFEHPEEPPSAKGVAPVKTCPQCEGLVHASARVCPLKNEKDEFCSYEFEKKRPKEDQEMGDLIIVTEGIDIDELTRRSVNKYTYYPMFKLAEPIVEAMFTRFPDPNSRIQIIVFEEYYKMCILWYNRTLAGIDGNLPDITNSEWHLKRARNHFNFLVKSKQLALEI